ncbi:MAG: type I restriction enzyme HsdR N-terminal domain-containing protein [Cyanobacteria bacterium P01_F01_bin.150]
MTTVLQGSNLSLREVEQRFNLQYIEDPNFFPEYRVSTSPLSELDKQILDRAKQDFLDLRKDSAKEELVKMVLVSPLLSAAGLYRYPFHVATEEAIELTLEDNAEVLRGRIDILVLKDNLWVMVIEAKKAEFSIHKAVPQTLSYLMSNPNPTQISFGLVTNGSELMFLKLKQPSEEQTSPSYGFSRIFSLFNPGNELYEVVTILQHLEHLGIC